MTTTVKWATSLLVTFLGAACHSGVETSDSSVSQYDDASKSPAELYKGNPFEKVADIDGSTCFKRVYSDHHLKNKAPKQTVTQIAAKLYFQTWGEGDEYLQPMMRLSVKVRDPDAGSNATVAEGSLSLACQPNAYGTVGGCYIDCDGPHFKFRYSKASGREKSLYLDTTEGYLAMNRGMCDDIDVGDEEFVGIFLDNSTNVDDIFRVDPVSGDEDCDLD